MRLHPNPPRMVTVVVAVALLALGAVVALPVEPALGLLEPVEAFLGDYGLTFDVQMGWLCLFLGNVLLIAGSLLPGI